MRWWMVATLSLTLGCPDDPPAPPPVGDASVDAPRPDVGRPDVFVPDAGPTGPRVDGVVDDFEWRFGTDVENETATDREGSTLTRMRAVLHEGRLVVAVEGSLAAGDALLVYVDRAVGEADGQADLADEEGPLDVALSTDLTLPDDFRVDAAFGTLAMPSVADDDERTGWRDPADATTLAAFEGAAMVCGADACEAALPLAELGGEAPRTLGLFARIRHMDGTWTNQTLPEDAPADPTTVGAWLELEDGMEMPDAGPPDAGMPDAGPMGIVVDGVVSPGEWDGAAVVDDETRTTAGTAFEGNALDALRVVRTDTDLFLAVEGTLTSGNVLLVYVDAEVGGGEGVVNGSEFDDLSGALDLAIATKPIILPAELRVDFVWGTLDTSRVAVGADDRMGWRDVGTNPSMFMPLDASAAPSACSETACETRVPLSALGVVDTIGLVVRLGDADGETFSNQTLPQDDDPAFVTRALEIPSP